MKAQFLKAPVDIVVLDEGIDGLTDLLEVLEDPTVDGLFLQGAVEPLGHAVGLGLGNESEARGWAGTSLDMAGILPQK